MQILLPVFYFLLCLAAIRYFRFFKLGFGNPWVPSVLFSLKVLAGLMMLWLYTGYYDKNTADVFRLFDDAVLMHEHLLQHPRHFFEAFLLGNDIDYQSFPQLADINNWEHRNHVMEDNSRSVLLLHVLLMFLSRSYLGVHLVLFNFMSFSGLFGIFHFFNSGLTPERKKQIAAAIIFLFPGSLFWLSGLTKESIVVLFSGLTLYALLTKQRESPPWRFAFLFLAGLLGLLLTRKFLFLIFLFYGSLFLIHQGKKPKNSGLQYLVYTFSILLLIAITDWLIPSFSIAEILIHKHNSFLELALQYQSGSMIRETTLQNTGDLIRYFPLGMVSVLFRPFIWEASGVVQILASIENLLLLVIFIWSVFRIRKLNPENTHVLPIFVSLSWIIIISLSVPVLGAASRYRVIPLLLLLIPLVFSSMKSQKA